MFRLDFSLQKCLQKCLVDKKIAHCYDYHMKLPNNKLDVKIIAFDMDDTLLTGNLTILPRTAAALQKAVEKGIYIVLASGRAENAMLSFVRALSIAGTQQGRYLISMNGSAIYDLHLRTQIYSRIVPKEIMQFAYSEAKKRGLNVQVYSPSSIMASADNKWVQQDVHLSKLNLEIIPDYETFLSENDFPKMVIPAEPEVVKEFMAFLKKELGDKAVIFNSKPYFLEVMPPNAGKGEALLWLAEQLKIPVSQTMAFGDSMNDWTMLTKVAHGVAMCNGTEETKNLARYVTRLDNEHDGIADFLEEFVF